MGVALGIGVGIFSFQLVVIIGLVFVKMDFVDAEKTTAGFGVIDFFETDAVFVIGRVDAESGRRVYGIPEGGQFPDQITVGTGALSLVHGIGDGEMTTEVFGGHQMGIQLTDVV